MIAPREERRGLRAAKPVLVLGAAPSRAGGNIAASPAGTGAGSRIALYSGTDERKLADLFDFANMLDEWPGAAEGESGKWDDFPDVDSWTVGQRVQLLHADLCERPRLSVVVLGTWTFTALRHWWTDKLRPSNFFEGVPGPGGCAVYPTPHPSGTSLWWNDPANRRRGERFWHEAADVALLTLPKAPAKVKLHRRSAWLVALGERLNSEGWPEECVDWPWIDPPGRPQALLRGESVPAAHVTLEMFEGPRPSKKHQALHSCDRGQHCVNGAHLRWGLEIENRLDQVSRQRGDIGKIGLDVAREIRVELEEIAERRGVPMDALARIAGGKTWTEDKWETS